HREDLGLVDAVHLATSARGDVAVLQRGLNEAQRRCRALVARFHRQLQIVLELLAQHAAAPEKRRAAEPRGTPPNGETLSQSPPRQKPRAPALDCANGRCIRRSAAGGAGAWTSSRRREATKPGSAPSSGAWDWRRSRRISEKSAGAWRRKTPSCSCALPIIAGRSCGPSFARSSRGRRKRSRPATFTSRISALGATAKGGFAGASTISTRPTRSPTPTISCDWPRARSWPLR